jgi:hypothetical protein
MIFQINTIDIVPYIVSGGVQWTRADVDGPNAGRDADGNLTRDRVAIKYRADITCRPLTKDEAYELFSALSGEWVMVTTDIFPFSLTTTTRTMYTNNFSARFVATQEGERWVDVSFPLIEQ